MKKTLLSIFTVMLATAAFSQCIPNPEYADEPFGVWPSPEDGFADGEVGVLYTQVIDFKIPNDAGEIDAAFAGQTINSVKVLGIVNIPPGLTWACASHTADPCEFLPNTPGCGLISGTPTSGGEYLMTINALVNLTTAIGVIDFPYPFTGYAINVDGPVSVAEMEQYGLAMKQNMPNPFTHSSAIDFSLNQSMMVEFNVFDMVGRNIHSRAINASTGMNRIDINAANMGLTTGVYLYTLTINGQSVTRKMVVK
jgi:hypothetical protein